MYYYKWVLLVCRESKCLFLVLLSVAGAQVSTTSRHSGERSGLDGAESAVSSPKQDCERVPGADRPLVGLSSFHSSSATSCATF